MKRPTAQPSIAETHFENPRLSAVGLEVLTLAQLRTKVSPARLSKPEQIDFLMVLLIEHGTGRHKVDFESIRLSPGTVVVVQPGSVQQWQLHASLEGTLLLVSPAAAQPASTDLVSPGFKLLRVDEWPSAFTLSEPERSDWSNLAAVLRHLLDKDVVDEIATALARELFLCLMLKLAMNGVRTAGSLKRGRRSLYFQLQRALNELVRRRPTVAGLAMRLHVSPSTLNRVCHAQGKASAKQFIDRRIALEAQRLLVHSAATAAAIGQQLGFSEPTNFQKFFRRQVGATPEMFRRKHQRG